MKKVLLVLLIVPILVLLIWGLTRLWFPEDTWICKNGEWVKHGKPSAPMPSYPCQKEGERANGEKPSLANPAAQNCLDKGGKLKTVKETVGDLGICQFDDGSECEEWQFYREQCQKGELKTADTAHPYSGIIKKTANGYLFKADSGVEYVLNLVANAGEELKNRLLVEAGSNQSVTVMAAEIPPLSKTLILKGFQEK
jgi:putative hemolysin